MSFECYRVLEYLVNTHTYLVSVQDLYQTYAREAAMHKQYAEQSNNESAEATVQGSP